MIPLWHQLSQDAVGFFFCVCVFFLTFTCSIWTVHYEGGYRSTLYLVHIHIYMYSLKPHYLSKCYARVLQLNSLALLSTYHRKLDASSPSGKVALHTRIMRTCQNSHTSMFMILVENLQYLQERGLLTIDDLKQKEKEYEQLHLAVK